MAPSDKPREHCEPAPDSGMGGASDSGAHGIHPASHPEAPPLPEQHICDVAIERRHHHDETYGGPERRQGDR
jgi:hypothetical protein